MECAVDKDSVIYKIIDTARWCPSPDNVQPWRFKIIDELCFEIHITDCSDWMVYDINGHATWLNIGFLLECIDIAAKEYGIKCNYNKLSSSDNKHQILFEATLSKKDQVNKDPLFDFIPHRSVQRRAMGSKKLTSVEKNLINSTLDNSNFSIKWFESLTEKIEIAKLTFGNSKTRYTMKEGFDVHRKVIDWRKGYERYSPNKIPPMSLGVDPITVKLTKWILGSWKRFHFIEKYLGGTLWAQFMMDFYPSIRSSGHFLLTLNHEAKTLNDFIESGRVIMRLWLTCEKLSLGFQPEHMPVMFSELIRHNIKFTEDSRTIKNAIKMDAAFKKLVGENQVKHSVFLARVGRSKQPSSRSVRLEVNDLII